MKLFILIEKIENIKLTKIILKYYFSKKKMKVFYFLGASMIALTQGLLKIYTGVFKIKRFACGRDFNVFSSHVYKTYF